MSDTDYYSVLRIKAFNDLANRAKPGIFIYAIVWFAIAFSLNLHESSPLFFQINSGLIVLIFITRLTHLFLRKQVDKHNVNFLEMWLTTSILLAALHWGLMSAWIFYDSELTNIEPPMLIVLAAFAMGGTSTLSISPLIRKLYPVVLFYPSIIYFLWNQNPNDLLYAGLMVTSWGYILIASKSAEHDYWQAISNNLIAEERAKELEKLSVTDPLTQIKNRMFFDAEFEKEWQRGARLKSCLSILMVDLDYFKQINDNYGHVFGDEVLIKVASCLSETLMRPADCVARYGGEEFILLLPNTGEEGASTIAERLTRKVAELHFEHDEKKVQITCSIGGATSYPHPNQDRADLVKRADSALYEAKDQGRNRFIFNEEALDPSVPLIGR
ncbi:MAG: GGDEF domain-containing protein [Oleiphilaceae bacterium]|nr:GGDEF domain-containing protein [Oleiphilaceae bacterium]